MKAFSKVTIGLGLLLGSGFGAMANSVWTQNDADFPDLTYEVAAPFVTDSFSIGAIGPEKYGEFTAPLIDDAYLPNPGVPKYTDPYLDSDLTSAVEKIGISQSVLPVNADISGVTDFVAAPEPFGLPFLGAAAILIGILARRKLLRVS